MRRALRKTICCTSVGLVLIGYLLGALGFPLPTRSLNTSTENYPCKNRPCGCRCAEDCWRHCCCFSVQERLAWARANGIEPPDYFMEQVARSRSAESSCGCCCCCEREDKQEPKDPMSFVVGSLSAKCRGTTAGVDWLSNIPALPPGPHMHWLMEQKDAGGVIVCDHLGPNRSESPDNPPPRF